MLEILDPYLPIPDEARKVEKAGGGRQVIEFPARALNWDYELGKRLRWRGSRCG